jgi:dipeptide/tripeptide permease
MDATKDHATPESHTQKKSGNHNVSYRNLLMMAALSFLSMYILMYAMVNVAGNVVNNLNQVYMAGLMAAPMIVIELVLMRMMYPNKRRNRLIMAASIIAMVAFFVFIRQQTAIGDKQFLRSMIPHHAGAITMCEEASITEPQIQELCEAIVSSQEAETDQMRTLLEELE